MALAALRVGLPAGGWLQRCVAQTVPSEDRLRSSAFGLQFANPLGLAAGMDKNGRALGAWPALGFGFAEIGTITPRPQAGNPQPRLFRVPELRAVVNRMGFNSAGAEAVARNLGNVGTAGSIVGANVGKNKDTPNELAAEDYVAAITALRGRCDYFAVNVSSPNTPALRALQSPQALQALVASCVQAAHPTPVLVKVAPDFAAGELEDSVGAAVDGGAAGIIASNTTLTRPDQPLAVLREAGGLSGEPLRALAKRTVARAYRAVGARVPIVGVGGVASGEDAWQLLLAGASLVQIFTALVYQGPGLPRKILHELLQIMDREGVRQFSEAIGQGATS